MPAARPADLSSPALEQPGAWAEVEFEVEPEVESAAVASNHKPDTPESFQQE